MKQLFILRGLPGSGKTQLAKELAPTSNFSNDQFFEQLAEEQKKLFDEVFNETLRPQALEWCFSRTEAYLRRQVSPIAVHNVFSRVNHVFPYIELGKRYGYKVHVITVENHHNSPSEHGVKNSRLRAMLKGWQHFLPRELHDWEHRKVKR